MKAKGLHERVPERALHARESRSAGAKEFQFSRFQTLPDVVPKKMYWVQKLVRPMLFFVVQAKQEFCILCGTILPE